MKTFIHLLSFKGTASRKEHALVWLGVIGSVILVFLSEEPLKVPQDVILTILFFLPLAVFPFILCVGVRRLHDLGLPTIAILLYFIPIANIILFSYLTFQLGRNKDNPSSHPK